MADHVIIGAGVVGLTTALEIKRRQSSARVIVLEKEPRPGLHSSGRNSGVLHSGIYYPANSLKARLCGQGARQMAQYCLDRHLPMIRPGKLLIPTRREDARLLDVLEERGRANGVEVRRVGAEELDELEPEAGSATGEALLVTTTAVVDSAAIMRMLAEDAVKAGVDLRCGGRLTRIDVEHSEVEWAGERIVFGRALNCAGLFADRIAHRFGVGQQYLMLPFKGSYWRLNPASGLRLNHLVYPVPDLRVPFLGVHTTKAINGDIYIGPTATPVFGRENYHGLRGIRPGDAAEIACQLTRAFLSGREGFRRLVWQETLHSIKPAFAAAARQLLPRLRNRDLLPSSKAGLRAQLFDRERGMLVNDFLVQSGTNSVHVLNAVSPAFTSAFALARHLCENELGL